MHYIIFDFFTRSRNLFVLNFRILTLYNKKKRMNREENGKILKIL
nr:MAG TPA: hypothetical protein [Caudoviricetes sp.]